MLFAYVARDGHVFMSYPNTQKCNIYYFSIKLYVNAMR